MITRYDIPAQAQYNNTYVPIPFQELLQAGLTKQNQYNQGAEAKDAYYKALQDVKVAPGKDEQDYQEKMQKLDSTLKDVETNSPDMGSYEFKSNLNNIMREQNRDSWWRNARQNRELYLKAQENLQKEGSKNREYNISPAQRYLQDFEQHGTQGLMQTGNGNFQMPNTTDYADYGKKIETFMDDARPNSANVEYYDPKTGYFKVKRGREELAVKDLYTMGMGRAREFFDSLEGKNFINKVTYDLGRQPSNEEVYKAYSDSILASSKERAYRKTSDGIDFDSAMMKKLDDDSQNRVTSLYSHITPNSITPSVADTVDPKKEFDERGNYKGDRRSLWEQLVISNRGSGIPGVGGLDDASVTKGLDDNIMTQEKLKYIMNLRKSNPNLKNLSDKQLVEADKGARENLKARQGLMTNINNTERKILTEMIFGSGEKIGDFSERTAYIRKKDGTLTNGTQQELASELGYKGGIPVEALKKATVSFLTPYGKEAGSFIAQIPDKKGNPRSIEIQQDEELKKVFSGSNGVANLISKAQEGFIPQRVNQDGTEEGFYVKPVLKAQPGSNGKGYDGKYEPIINYVKKGPDGSFNKLTDKNYDVESIFEQERNKVMGSDFVRTNYAK
jgi:hypothetical protein